MAGSDTPPCFAGDRDGRRRGRRGGRNRHRDDDRRGPPGQEGGGIDALLNLETLPAERPPERPEVSGGSPRAQKAITVLRDLVRLIGFNVTAHLVQDDNEEIHIDMRGPDEARVIGAKGDTLLSLQFVLNRVVSRALNKDKPESEREEGEEGQVVVLDAADYRRRRRAALADLARRLAQRAIQERKVVRLSPMSAHDRRVFHMTLKEVEGVDTRSEGDGLYRNLLIIPAEYAKPRPLESEPPA